MAAKQQPQPQQQRQPPTKRTTLSIREQKGRAGTGKGKDGAKGGAKDGTKDAAKLVAITAYDATFARLVDQAGADIVMVGDSVGMVVQGHPSTIPVTLDEIIYHTRAAARVVRRAHLVADLPFLSYQVSVEEGVRAAGRLIKEGGAESVKLEGGVEMAELVARLTRLGIPVMGHVGMTPQSVHQFGGFRVQGRTDEQGAAIFAGARALAEAGAYAVVIECVPRALAAKITKAIPVPTIGIGAGPDCDGQVLVMHDLLGLNPDFKPRFVRRYADLAQVVTGAFEAFAGDVRAGRFPSDDESFT